MLKSNSISIVMFRLVNVLLYDAAPRVGGTQAENCSRTCVIGNQTSVEFVVWVLVGYFDTPGQYSFVFLFENLPNVKYTERLGS